MSPVISSLKTAGETKIVRTNRFFQLKINFSSFFGPPFLVCYGDKSVLNWKLKKKMKKEEKH